MGNAGIGTNRTTDTKLYVKSNQAYTGTFENTTGNTALYVKGKMTAEGDMKLAASQDHTLGNAGIGTGAYSDTKLYVMSNQAYTGTFENTGGKTALYVKGNLIAEGDISLAASADDVLGNVGIGVAPAPNAKLYVKSSENFTGVFENTNTNNFALYVKGQLRAEGNVFLAGTLNNQSGNVGIGVPSAVNSKLTVKSNQDYAGIFENTLGKTALSVTGIFESKGNVNLSPSSDNSLGNTGIGSTAVTNSKLYVNSNE